MQTSVSINGGDLWTLCGVEALEISGHLGMPKVRGRTIHVPGRDGADPIGRAYQPKIIQMTGTIRGSSVSDYLLKCQILRQLVGLSPANALRRTTLTEDWKTLIIHTDEDVLYRARYGALTIVSNHPRHFASSGKFTLMLECAEAYGVSVQALQDAWNASSNPTWRVFETGTAHSVPLIKITGPMTLNGSDEFRIISGDVCFHSNFDDTGSAAILNFVDIFGDEFAATLYGPKTANELLTDWDMEDDAVNWAVWSSSTVTKESPGRFGDRCVKGVADTGTTNAIAHPSAIGLTAGTDYRLAAWVRGNPEIRALGATDGWWVSNGDGRAAADEWAYVEGVFRPATSENYGVYAEAAANGGTVRIDNVSLMENLVSNGGFPDASFVGQLCADWNHPVPLKVAGKNTCAWDTDCAQCFVSTGSGIADLTHDQITGLTNGGYYLFSFWAKRDNAGSGRVYVDLDGATPQFPWGTDTGDEDGLGCGIEYDHWRRFAVPIKMLGTTLDLAFYGGDDANCSIVIDDVCLIELEEYDGSSQAKRIHTRMLGGKPCLEVAESQVLLAEPPTAGVNTDHASIMLDFHPAWGYDHDASYDPTCGMDYVIGAILHNASATHLNELVAAWVGQGAAPEWDEAGFLTRTRRGGYHKAAQNQIAADLTAEHRRVAVISFNEGGDLDGGDMKTRIFVDGETEDTRQESNAHAGVFSVAQSHLFLAPVGWLRRVAVFNKAVEAEEARRLYGCDEDFEPQTIRFIYSPGNGNDLLESETLIIDCEKQTIELFDKDGDRTNEADNLDTTSVFPILRPGGACLYLPEATMAGHVSWRKRWL